MGNTIFSLYKENTKGITILFILYCFLLIFYIKTINNSYTYIEKFITKLAINDSRSECKLLYKISHFRKVKRAQLI
ncbi:hypothetical protein COJ42_28925 [Bacillus cereus]|nr:hypothetical protein CN464_30525 [Bacillus cereus]PFM26133.1 hypothetical protein COJ42_28925 [Bacillus cereus]PFP83819.1 hypothetical protein COK02_28590 [Bacillus cereus]PGN51183.1 hypothetical protein CN966_27170 [Bacillus cereus]